MVEGEYSKDNARSTILGGQSIREGNFSKDNTRKKILEQQYSEDYTKRIIHKGQYTKDNTRRTILEETTILKGQ